MTVDGRPARLDTAKRTLTYAGRTVNAGLGPTSLAAGKQRLYVTDRVQDALLLYRFRPRLELQRRVYVAGGPRLVVRRGDRLEVTTDQGSVELTADGVARVLRRRTK